ncbi:MAG: DNA-binding protein [Nitrososphaeraceae archaeon]|nr:DNA-binding protein [Nitrososphaeraceae archaeon]MBV9669175.1 DNA-binding protein [Nitrososphaeraceae archaeon]
MSSPQPQHQPNDDESKRKEEETAAAMRQRALMILLEPPARQRLTNIRMVKPELAAAVESYLINAASAGRLNRALTDEELKQVLLSLQQPKKEFRINRR